MKNDQDYNKKIEEIAAKEKKTVLQLLTENSIRHTYCKTDFVRITKDMGNRVELNSKEKFYCNNLDLDNIIENYQSNQKENG